MWTWFRPESESLTASLLALAITSSLIGCSSMKTPVDEEGGAAAPVDAEAAPTSGGGGSVETATHTAAAHSLFDGESLAGWEEADFGGQGKAHVEDGVLVLPQGDPLTGVRWTRPFPTMDYEIELEAMREVGSDFFCGLTFPVRDTCASLILGGWAGEICGISSLDYMDASENQTTFIRSFELNRWYAVKLRVTKTKIEAWLDGEKVVDIETTGRRIGTRPEIDLCRPLGFASYLTTAALRDIRWREVESP